jgi:hypothetical protein
MEAWLHSFLTLTLKWGGWSDSCCDFIIPEETAYSTNNNTITITAATYNENYNYDDHDGNGNKKKKNNNKFASFDLSYRSDIGTYSFVTSYTV